MPKEIEIYVHTSDHHEPKLVKISEESTVEDLLKVIAPEGHSEVFLIVEGEDEPKEHHHKLSHCGIKHRRHVHCHRCRKIEVSVYFNREIKGQFSPSATIAQILKWALGKFELTGADATDKSLRLTEKPNEPLAETTHIGSLAKHPHCSVHLNLADSIKTNG